MAHSQGTCVLLEVQTLDKLTEYFQILYSIYPGILFELRGGHITEVQSQAIEIIHFETKSFTCKLNEHNNDINDGVERISFQLKYCCAIGQSHDFCHA